MKDGTFQKVEPALMKDVFAAWVEDLDTRVALGEIRESTAATPKCNLRVHLAPPADDMDYAGGLGVYRSDALTPKVMAEWRSEMATKVGTGKMAPKSFNNVFALAGQIFRWARHPARAYMAHDPLIGQKRLKLSKNEAEFLEADDISALLAAASDDAEASALIHVMLFGGLRRSEAFGLKWSALETNGGNGGRLRVCRTIYQGQIIEKTKSDSSNRLVDVPRSVIDALARHGKATPPMDGDVVFRTSTGQPLRLRPERAIARRSTLQ